MTIIRQFTFPHHFFSFIDLTDLDHQLFFKINNDWTNAFLNDVFPWWRDASTWIPLYFFLVLLVFLNFGWKAWPWLVSLILTVSVSDQLSSHLLKNWVGRIRPCRDPSLSGNVHLLINRCPSSGSFPSSHATNHFALAFFLYLTLHKYIGKWAYLFFFWAASISYGQVYVGVHFPLDIVVGALLGSFLGYGFGTIFNRRIGLPPLLTTIKKEEAA